MYGEYKNSIFPALKQIEAGSFPIPNSELVGIHENDCLLLYGNTVVASQVWSAGTFWVTSEVLFHLNRS